MPKKPLLQRAFSIFDTEGDLSVEQKIELLDEAFMTMKVHTDEDISRLGTLIRKVLELLDRQHVLARLWTRQVLAGDCPIGIERPEVCSVGELCKHWQEGCCSFVPMEDPAPNSRERPYEPLRTGVKQRIA